ncbi:hypothetical protein NBRC116493_23150 [Aurantivibrio infirmus]
MTALKKGKRLQEIKKAPLISQQGFHIKPNNFVVYTDVLCTEISGTVFCHMWPAVANAQLKLNQLGTHSSR